MYGNTRNVMAHGLGLSSFADVEAKYNNTKPVVSKNHTVSQDVRPVGSRKRKWERVKKISDDCYILLTGYGLEDDVFGYGVKKDVTVEEQVALAAICWQREREGIIKWQVPVHLQSQGLETIKIRNGIGDRAHNSHYRFLADALPRGLEFLISNGKQFVSVAGFDTYYLPKTKYLPKHVWDRWVTSSTRKHFTPTDDGAFLTFTRTGTHQFKFSGDLHTIPKPPRKIVDKELKAKYKEPIAEYLEWISAIAPLLRTDDWGYRHTMRKEVYDYMKDKYHKQRLGQVPPELMLKIITEPEHPLRLHMALDFVADYGIIQHIKSQDDIKTAHVQYNRWINKQCGFLKTAA